MTEKVKYPEHIAALPADIVRNHLKISEGFDDSLAYPAFLSARSMVIWDQRSYLEDSLAFMQLLPYVVYCIVYEDPNRPDEIVLYRRAKHVGEAALLGNFSIGFGGHIDKPDYTVTSDGQFDLQGTIVKSRNRERLEETRIDTGILSWGQLQDCHMGFINDTSDLVGQKHLGIVSLVVLPEGSVVTSNEPNQIIQGTFTLDRLIQRALNGDSFENWTKLVMDYMINLFDSATGKLTAMVKQEKGNPVPTLVPRSSMNKLVHVE